VRDKLLNLAQNELSGENRYLVFDDSQLSKPYAKEIEGIDVGFDSSSGRAELGLQMITALITDLEIRLPIDVRPFFGKQIAGKFFKSKGELAAKIFTHLHEIFSFDLVVADAHYATKFFLSFLNNFKQAFLMKFTCNRIVTIGNKTGSLKKLMPLRRNEHFRCTRGLFDGNYYYFYVVKINFYTTCYFISLYEIEKSDLIAVYRIRWNIELYHRTAKQSLGWKDCQMRAIEKQELHTLYVMHAYASADIMRVKLRLVTTEDSIRMLWRAKPSVIRMHKLASMENFDYVV
jgi:hypothetical protein